MAADDIIDDLESVLSAGTWSNYHSTTPPIFDDDVRDYYRINKEGIWLREAESDTLYTFDHTLVLERQRCEVYGWSAKSVSTRDGMLDDIKSIFESNKKYLIDKIWRYRAKEEDQKKYLFKLLVKRLEV